MPLGALRSVGEAELESPLMQTEPSHTGCLPRQGQAPQYGVVAKGACLPVCNAHPTRVGGGVTEGQPRANNMTSNRHAPGSQRWKASRSLRARSPSREGTRARVSADSGRARGVSSPAQHHRVGDHGVLEQLRRRGASSHLDMRRRMRGEGRSFTPGRSARAAHRRRINPSPAQPVAGSQRRPQAALRRAMTFSVLTFRRACSAGRRMLSELTWLAARLSPKGVGCRTPCSSKGAAREAWANTKGDWLQKGRTFRVGEDRTLEKVVLARRKSVAEIIRRRRTQRSVRSPFHPI
jgi:hypothetical protein